MANYTKEWAAKKDEITQNLAIWYDKLQQYMAGHMSGLGNLIAGVMSDGSGGSDALQSMGIDPSVAMSALAPMLGLDNPDDTKALMDGLSEAGFQDLMKDFLTPMRR